MKKKLFYLVFLIGILHTAHSQVVNWDTALSQIKTPTSGFSSQKILLDKVASFANLYNYNDTDYNTSNGNHFKQSLAELYRASDAQYFTSPENYTLFENTITTATVIPIGIINTKCTYLNYDEENVSNGNLQLINGVFQPIRTTEPYFIEKELFVISPLFPSFASANNTFTFSFNLQQMYQYGNTIQGLEADFGDGVWRAVIQNSVMVQGTHTITLNITNVVKQKISFRITQQSGTQITTYAEISLSNKIRSASTARNGSCAVSTLLKHRSTIADAQNVKGEIEYKVYYGDLNTSCKLKKPIIIVDGFDPGDKRRIDYEECKLDPKCTDVNPDLNIKTYLSLSKLMEYNNGSVSLIDKMNAENYDVILVNFPYYQKVQNDLNSGEICAGADDIIRNGYSIASFIQKINNDLVTNGSAEKLVVVGPSMGGLITKYALAYLEKQGITHNTKLWVSMDSPHQGANIPLAIQQDIFFLGKKLKNAKADTQFNDLLHSKAAEQLLIDIVDYDGNSVKNTVNSNFLNTLNSNGVTNSNGYPVLDGIRKISISNGSFAGIKNVNPKENFLDIKASAKIKLFGIRVGRKRIFRIKNYYTPNVGESTTLVDNQGMNPEQNIENTNYSKSYTGYNPNGSMDAVPGGNTNASNDLKDEVNSSLTSTNAWSNQFISILTTSSSLIVDRVIPIDANIILTPQSFIPTHSSLDTNGFIDWYQPIDKNISCTGQTPFNSFYGESENNEHITFTDNMVKWLLEEINGNRQAPSFPIEAGKLAGPSMACIGINSTYAFSDVCQVPSAATWTVSPNLQIINSTGYSLTVNGLSDGNGTITGTFQNGQTVSVTVSIGIPTTVFSNANGTQTGSTFNYGYNGFGNFGSFTEEINLSNSNGVGNGVLGAEYEVFSPNSNTYEARGNGVTVTVNANDAFQIEDLVYINVRGRVLGDCGWSEWGDLTLTSYAEYFNRTTQNTYNVYPNPANDIVNIDLINQNNESVKEVKITGDLTDLSGMPVMTVPMQENKVTFSVKGLKKGIYILNICRDEKKENYKVIVE